jgi:hypothetical protein
LRGFILKQSFLKGKISIINMDSCIQQIVVR